MAWLRRPKVAWSAVTDELEQAGSVTTALAASSGAGQPSLFEDPSGDDVAAAAEDLQRWARAGVRMVTVLDERYPSNLRMIHQRPSVLFIRGGDDDRDEMSVAVVGTRHPTARGVEQASTLAAGLAGRGIPVVSGLAAGIDTAAHRAALAGGGRTIAVIGTGIDRVYPPQNADLQEEIATRGMVVSQFLPGSAPSKISFPMRNAVMSGYALATVVIEAAYRSGARMQARLALQHGRHVFLMRSLLEHDWARNYAQRPGGERGGRRPGRVRRPAPVGRRIGRADLGLTSGGDGQ